MTEKRVPKLRFRDESEGEFPEWEKLVFGNVCSFRGGTGFKVEFQGKTSGDLPFIKVSDMSLHLNNIFIKEANNWVSFSDAKMLKAILMPLGSVVFAKVGAALLLNRRRILQQDTIIDNNMMAAIPNNQIITMYLYQLLLTIDFAKIVHDGALPSINQKDMEEIKIFLPTKQEQQKIAAFLSAVDEKINLLKQQKTLWQEYKQGAMQQIFSQKIRFKDDDGRAFFEWEHKTLGEIASIKRGASPRPISSPRWFSNSSSIGWVRISDVSASSKYLESTEQYLSDEGVSKSRLVAKDNIIMSICATIGKPICTTFLVCIHDGFVVFDDFKGNKDFLYYYLQFIEKKWLQYGQPGTQINLNSEIVSNEYIMIPTLKEQQKIADFLSALDEKINQIDNQITAAQTWKQGLMQQMFI